MDGLVSNVGLIAGIAAAGAAPGIVAITGISGLIAGAISMALGEYVSVASQRDTERSDIAKETWELEHQSDMELEELTAIYSARGLTPELARDVAVQLTAHDALATHLRDELGISVDTLARPMQAAVSSALAFGVGAAVPMATAAIAGFGQRIVAILGASLVALIVLGFVGARAGGAHPRRPIVRVLVGGVLAMLLTMLVGKLFGAVVA